MKLIVALLALSTALAATTANAAEPKLARLHTVPATKESTFDVFVKAEAQQPATTLAAAVWKLIPGDAVRGNTHPGDRVIELYTGTRGAPILLARVVVRYQQLKGRWVPYFQMNEEPMVKKVNGRWQPIELSAGAPAILVQFNTAMPTADGFVPTLEFGLSGSALPIVAWQVR